MTNPARDARWAGRRPAREGAPGTRPPARRKAAAAALLLATAVLATGLRLPAGAADAPPETPAAPAYKPGQLDDAEKQRIYDRLLAQKRQADPRKASFLAARRQQERAAALLREHGVYDIATTLANGDSANRFDIVVVSAGFPKSEKAKLVAMTESLQKALAKIEPFRNYPSHLNVHRILVDDPDLKSARLTVTVDEDAIHGDFKKAREYGALAPDYDLVVVLCNITGKRATGGGAVGRPGIITIDSQMDLGRTFMHEMGHAFAHLSDEYVDASNASRPVPEETDPWATNVTRESDPKQAKWHYWLPPVWKTAHQPNLLPPSHKVGCFEGAFYREKGVYRPETECLMRHAQDYCLVCFEQVEKSFYTLIAPIDDARPRRGAIALWLDESVTLEADALLTAGGGNAIGSFFGFWTVDGSETKPSSQKSLTTTLQLTGRQLGPGPHDVGLRVDFSNKRIRRDHGWLSSSWAWVVDVGAHPRPAFKPVPPVSGAAGREIAFELSVPNPDPAAYTLEALDLPPGAAFRDGTFRWTPEKAHAGAWRPRFVLTDGRRVAEAAVEIGVADTGGKNYAPVLPPLEPIAVGEGETLEIAIEAVDVDGDHLVYSASGLPEGARLGAHDGVLRWTPGFRQAGRYGKIPIEVTDGAHVVKTTLDLVVEDRSIGEAARQRGERESAGPTPPPPAQRNSETARLAAERRRWDPEARSRDLRSPHDAVRLQAIKSLKQAPLAFRILESNRLLRDASAGVRAAALASIRELAESAGEAHLGMIVGDLAPHAWHFTDDPETLQWLQELAGKGPTTKARERLKTALKEIERYNRERGR